MRMHQCTAAGRPMLPAGFGRGLLTSLLLDGGASAASCRGGVVCVGGHVAQKRHGGQRGRIEIALLFIGICGVWSGARRLRAATCTASTRPRRPARTARTMSWSPRSYCLGSQYVEYICQLHYAFVAPVHPQSTDGAEGVVRPHNGVEEEACHEDKPWSSGGTGRSGSQRGSRERHHK